MRFGPQRREKQANKRKLAAEAAAEVAAEVAAAPMQDQVQIEDIDDESQEDPDADLVAAAEMKRRREIVDKKDIELPEIMEQIPEFLNIETVLFSLYFFKYSFILKFQTISNSGFF